MIDSFGTCVWQPAMGLDLVCPNDRDIFPQLTTAIFRCIGADKEWLTVQYGSHAYRVKPEVFQQVSTPKFLLWQEVFVPEKNRVAKVSALTWHFKDASVVYTLEFDGKRSSRRYCENELIKATGTLSINHTPLSAR
jgi:hypothetical protein